MASGVAIAGVVLAVAALISIIILMTLYLTQPRDIFPYGVPWNLITGGSQTFIADGNEILLINNGTTAVTVTKPNHNVTGLTFALSNINNTSAVTVSPTTGITLVGSNLAANGVNYYIWSDEATITQYG